jgi:hypothetical protein
VEKCYLCGATEKKLTGDHVPPKGFFPAPRPKNLIKVKCCDDCHKPLSLDDEAFRAWVAHVHNASPAGKTILKDKVVGSSFERSPKLRESVREHVGMSTLKTLGLQIPVPTISIPEERANKFLIRITKGLLAHFYRGYDYGSDQFSIKVPPPNRESLEYLRSIAKHCIRDSRGDGVFDFWRLVSPKGDGGVWIYLFYNEACFSVIHAPKSKWEKGEPPNTPLT